MMSTLGERKLKAEPPIIRLREVHKAYLQGDEPRVVLKGASGEVAKGEFVAIRGRSGSGKTTLLNLIAGLDTADAGEVIVDGINLGSLGEGGRTEFRRDHLGFVFQFFNLIPTLTVLENTILPSELAGTPTQRAQERAKDLLARVGLVGRMDDPPDQLSGGEQQRVAIARALVQCPEIILADEPTGNLDLDTGEIVLSLLLEVTAELGKTLMVVTHSHEIAARADRVLTIRHGKLLRVEGPSMGEA
jgi:putative ABC transport system ATP-binding protein